jgi:hypothetical protein
VADAKIEATPNPERLKKSAVTPGQIEHFLEQTGFVFEMRTNEVFLKAGYLTEINEEFLDLEGDTQREIDIIASKVVNDISIHFVVECKQSATDKWIFICNKRIRRSFFSVDFASLKWPHFDHHIWPHPNR